MDSSTFLDDKARAGAKKRRRLAARARRQCETPEEKHKRLEIQRIRDKIKRGSATELELQWFKGKTVTAKAVTTEAGKQEQREKECLKKRKQRSQESIEVKQKRQESDRLRAFLRRNANLLPQEDTQELTQVLDLLLTRPSRYHPETADEALERKRKVREYKKNLCGKLRRGE